MEDMYSLSAHDLFSRCTLPKDLIPNITRWVRNDDQSEQDLAIFVYKEMVEKYGIKSATTELLISTDCQDIIDLQALYVSFTDEDAQMQLVSWIFNLQNNLKEKLPLSEETAEQDSTRQDSPTNCLDQESIEPGVSHMVVCKQSVVLSDQSSSVVGDYESPDNGESMDFFGLEVSPSLELSGYYLYLGDDFEETFMYSMIKCKSSSVYLFSGEKLDYKSSSYVFLGCVIEDGDVILLYLLHETKLPGGLNIALRCKSTHLFSQMWSKSVPVDENNLSDITADAAGILKAHWTSFKSSKISPFPYDSPSMKCISSSVIDVDQPMDYDKPIYYDQPELNGHSISNESNEIAPCDENVNGCEKSNERDALNDSIISTEDKPSVDVASGVKTNKRKQKPRVTATERTRETSVSTRSDSQKTKKATEEKVQQLRAEAEEEKKRLRCEKLRQNKLAKELAKAKAEAAKIASLTNSVDTRTSEIASTPFQKNVFKSSIDSYTPSIGSYTPSIGSYTPSIDSYSSITKSIPVANIKTLSVANSAYTPDKVGNDRDITTSGPTNMKTPQITKSNNDTTNKAKVRVNGDNANMINAIKNTNKSGDSACTRGGKGKEKIINVETDEDDECKSESDRDTRKSKGSRGSAQRVSDGKGKSKDKGKNKAKGSSKRYDEESDEDDNECESESDRDTRKSKGSRGSAQRVSDGKGKSKNKGKNKVKGSSKRYDEESDEDDSECKSESDRDTRKSKGSRGSAQRVSDGKGKSKDRGKNKVKGSSKRYDEESDEDDSECKSESDRDTRKSKGSRGSAQRVSDGKGKSKNKGKNKVKGSSKRYDEESDEDDSECESESDRDTRKSKGSRGSAQRVSSNMVYDKRYDTDVERFRDTGRHRHDNPDKRLHKRLFHDDDEMDRRYTLDMVVDAMEETSIRSQLAAANRMLEKHTFLDRLQRKLK